MVLKQDLYRLETGSLLRELLIGVFIGSCNLAAFRLSLYGQWSAQETTARCGVESDLVPLPIFVFPQSFSGRPQT
jgi:hypothetical protein